MQILLRVISSECTMKKLVVLIFLNFLLIYSNILCQNGSINIEDQILEDIGKTGIQSLIENEMKLSNSQLQEIQTNSESGNYSNIFYNGNANQSVINQQNGEGNSAILLRIGDNNFDNILQNGNSNQYSSNISGDNISNDISQNGDGNNIDQTLIGNNLNYSISQQGNNLEVLQTETNNNSVGYDVKQSGEGMRIIITNGLLTN